MSTLTHGRLLQALHYEPGTGIFTWLQCNLKSNRSVGQRAGTLSGKYRRIGLDKRYYREHRLAWFYVHGKWPHQQIDHIDGDRLNNRICNLRDVSLQVNLQNRRVTKNKHGVFGVYRCGNRFGAQISINNRPTNLGYFSSPALAHAAYVDAKRKFHPGNTL